jgi:FkbM family methyltransferase
LSVPSQRVVADDHRDNIQTLLAAFGRHCTPRGVVHVGAHHGEEVAAYRDFGFGAIVLVEPNPRAFEVLRQRFSDASDVILAACAACSQDGEVELHINVSRTGSDEASSILELKRLGEVVQTLKTVSTLVVPARRLDALMDERALDPRAYNLLVVDVQGAELQVFAGAQTLLRHVDAVVSEVNLIEMYRDCAQEVAVQGALDRVGLVPVASLYHELYDASARFPAWGETLFVRRSLIASSPRRHIVSQPGLS